MTIDSVKPTHYDLSLYDLELGGKFSYQGTIHIQLDVKSSSKEIVLNAHQLQLKTAEIESNGTSREAIKISYEKKSQRVVLTFQEEIPALSQAILTCEYSGTMNDVMAGFYRSRYKPTVAPAKSVPMDGDLHCMFSTQFESSDARRALPCFDEPNLKATFDFRVEIPDDLVALSNMPQKDVRQGKNGRKVISFDRTPLMSTYLLAWAIGDFEYVEAFTERKYRGKNLPVRVYTARGLRDQGRFALETCHRVIDIFSEVLLRTLSKQPQNTKMSSPDV